MTPLQAYAELVVERRDLPEYEIEGRCCNPRCANRADDPHEIRPRSQTAGMAWWIEIPGKFLIGNRVGICRSCHIRTDDHTVAIIYDDQESTLAWVDLTENWAESLDPMPPIHKVVEPAGEPLSTAIEIQLPDSTSGVPALPVPEQGAPSDMELLARRVQATDKFLEQVAGDVRSVDEGPQPAVPVEPPPVGQELSNEQQIEVDQAIYGVSFSDITGRRINPTEVSAPDQDFQTIPPPPDLVDEVEGYGIQPVELDPEPEPEPVLLAGDDTETVERARAVAEELQQRASTPPELEMAGIPMMPWRADVIVFPKENRVEVVGGDLRVGAFFEEQIAKAKRAPKPKPPKPPDDPDRPREPTKARRTFSIAVPSDERDGEKVAAGEDGYALLEDALAQLRERFGRDEFPGWRYHVLIDALNWTMLNYSDEGED